jgi:hypothetical protein
MQSFSVVIKSINALAMPLNSPDLGLGPASGLYIRSSYQPCKFKPGKCSVQKWKLESTMKKTVCTDHSLFVSVCLSSHAQSVHEKEIEFLLSSFYVKSNKVFRICAN